MAIALPDEEYIEWGLSMLSGIFDEDDPDRDAPLYIRRIIENNAVVFLQDAWEQEELKNNKFSFAFVDEGYFNMFVDALKIAKFNNRMSAILINLKERKVEYEHIFPCANYQKEESLFDMPVFDENGSGHQQIKLFDLIKEGDDD